MSRNSTGSLSREWAPILHGLGKRWVPHSLALLVKVWRRETDTLFPCVRVEYPDLVANKWLEFAQKMARAARAGLAVERRRLLEIMAER